MELRPKLGQTEQAKAELKAIRNSFAFSADLSQAIASDKRLA